LIFNLITKLIIIAKNRNATDYLTGIKCCSLYGNKPCQCALIISSEMHTTVIVWTEQTWY